MTTEENITYLKSPKRKQDINDLKEYVIERYKNNEISLKVKDFLIAYYDQVLMEEAELIRRHDNGESLEDLRKYMRERYNSMGKPDN